MRQISELAVTGIQPPQKDVRWAEYSDLVEENQTARFGSVPSGMWSSEMPLESSTAFWLEITNS